MPYALILRLISGPAKDTKILLAGKETSNNLRQISAILSKKEKTKIFVCEFSLHPYFDQKFEKSVCVIEYCRIAWDPSWFQMVSCRLFRLWFLVRWIHKFDVVLFNWTDSFLHLNLDYLLFRMSGTKVFVRHCGSDVRYPPLQHFVHSYFGIEQWKKFSCSLEDLLSKLIRQVLAENLATGVISTRDHSTFQLRPLIVRPYIQSALPRSSWHETQKKIILHAPSDPKLKGTPTVELAIKALAKKRNDFEFKVISEQSHETVLEWLSRACILIDQPGAVPARLATEGFASGCIVIGGNIKDIHGYADCPAFQFPNDFQGLADLVDRILSDEKLLIETSNSSLKFWEKRCSERAFMDFFDALLDGSAEKFERVSGHERLMRNGTQNIWEKAVIRLRYGKSELPNSQK